MNDTFKNTGTLIPAAQSPAVQDTAEPTPVTRIFKARLFEMIFSDKKELLELYNAVSKTTYTDPELLEINTLENAIYMSMRNDISFLIDSRLSLYEHQSSYNPNLPLRYLMYISDLYSGMTKDANLYGTKKIPIPTPKFLIFYNGVDEQPDRQTLRLSDMYTVPEDSPALELEAVMMNINPGHNPEILASCQTLKDYSEYTARVRKYAAAGEMSLGDAVELAITECIREGILADFLSKNRAEAKKVSIYEYDAEKHMRQEREAEYERGWNDGREQGLSQGENNKLLELTQKKLAKGKTLSQIADELEESRDTIQKLINSIQQQNNPI